MKFSAFAFLSVFIIANSFGAIQFTPVFELPQGDSNIQMEIATYGVDVHLELENSPDSFVLVLSQTEILRNDADRSTVDLVCTGVPQAPFTEIVNILVTNIEGQPNTRTVPILFKYELSIDNGMDFYAVYSSYTITDYEYSSCFAYENYFEDINGIHVFKDPVFYMVHLDGYYVCGDEGVELYPNTYNLYHSLDAIQTIPFSASASDGIESVTLEIKQLDTVVHSETKSYTASNYIDVSGSFTVDFSYIEGTPDQKFPHGDYSIYLILLDKTGQTILS